MAEVELNFSDYDKRSGCYIKLGEKHGVGKAQPVGSKESPKEEGVPYGCWSKEIKD